MIIISSGHPDFLSWAKLMIVHLHELPFCPNKHRAPWSIQNDKYTFYKYAHTNAHVQIHLMQRHIIQIHKYKYRVHELPFCPNKRDTPWSLTLVMKMIAMPTKLWSLADKWTYKHKRNMFKLLNELLSLFYKSSSWDLLTINWREFEKILQRHCRHCPRSENTKKYLSDTREPVKTSETHWQIRQIGGKHFTDLSSRENIFKTVKTFPWSGILRTHVLNKETLSSN